MCVALRHSLITILFQRGQFDACSTEKVAAVLPYYLIGMIGMAPMNLMTRAFYSVYKFGMLGLLGALSVVSYAAMGFFLVGQFSYVGMGLSYATHWNVSFLIHSVLLAALVGRFWGKRDLVFLVEVGSVSLLAGTVVHSVYPVLQNGIGLYPSFATLFTGGCLVYIAFCMILRVPESLLIVRHAAKYAKKILNIRLSRELT